jgi:hypothetical protein
MKRCPRCRQTYSDDDLNFCLNDGELLTSFENDPPPTIFGVADDRLDDSPTIMLDRPRVTNQANWPPGQPLTGWQPANIAGQAVASGSRDQTLPTISLILGILSVVMICCYGCVWLGLPAAIVGFIGMRNAEKDPSRFSGRGLAIAGMVTGIVSFLAFIAWMILIIGGSLV